MKLSFPNVENICIFFVSFVLLIHLGGVKCNSSSTSSRSSNQTVVELCKNAPNDALKIICAQLNKWDSAARGQSSFQATWSSWSSSTTWSDSRSRWSKTHSSWTVWSAWSTVVNADQQQHHTDDTRPRQSSPSAHVPTAEPPSVAIVQQRQRQPIIDHQQEVIGEVAAQDRAPDSQHHHHQPQPSISASPSTHFAHSTDIEQSDHSQSSQNINSRLVTHNPPLEIEYTIATRIAPDYDTDERYRDQQNQQQPYQQAQIQPSDTDTQMIHSQAQSQSADNSDPGDQLYDDEHIHPSQTTDAYSELSQPERRGETPPSDSDSQSPLVADHDSDTDADQQSEVDSERDQSTPSRSFSANTWSPRNRRPIDRFGVPPERFGHTRIHTSIPRTHPSFRSSQSWSHHAQQPRQQHFAHHQRRPQPQPQLQLQLKLQPTYPPNRQRPSNFETVIQIPPPSSQPRSNFVPQLIKEPPRRAFDTRLFSMKQDTVGPPGFQQAESVSQQRTVHSVLPAQVANPPGSRPSIVPQQQQQQQQQQHQIQRPREFQSDAPQRSMGTVVNNTQQRIIFAQTVVRPPPAGGRSLQHFVGFSIAQQSVPFQHRQQQLSAAEVDQQRFLIQQQQLQQQQQMQQPQQLQQQQIQQQQLQQQQLQQQQLQQQQLHQQQLQQQQLQQQQLQQKQLQQQQLQQQQLQQQQQVQQQQQEPQWESVRSDDRRFEPSGRQQTTTGFGTGTAPENQNFGIRLSQRPVSPQQQFPPSSEREFISPSDRQQTAQQTQPQQWSIETQRFGSVSRPTQPPLASVQHPQSRWTHAHVQQPAALHQSQPQPLPQPQPLQASSQQALPTQQPFDAHAQEHISSRRPEEFVWRPQADSANRRSRPSDFFRKNGSDPYECMDILCLCPYMGGRQIGVDCRLPSGEKIGLALRKEYRQLTSRERDNLHMALIMLKRTRVYDRIALWHSNPESSGGAHSGPAFLPWHREYIKRLEIALRMIDHTVALPYWDSTLDSRIPNPSESCLFSAELMGETDRNGNVITGFTSRWNIDGRPYLKRQPGAQGRPFTEADIAAVMQREDVSSILAYTAPRPGCEHQTDWTCLEYSHGNVLIFVGGEMFHQMTSANDPLFFLHHAFVDRIWEDWRKLRQSAIARSLAYPPDLPNCSSEDHFARSPMRPFAPLRNIDGISNRYTSNLYTYAPRPSCSRGHDQQCASEFLFCDLSHGPPQCAAKIRIGGPCWGFVNGERPCLHSECTENICIPVKKRSVRVRNKRQITTNEVIIDDELDENIDQNDCFNSHECCAIWSANGHCGWSLSSSAINTTTVSDWCKASCSKCHSTVDLNNECSNRHGMCQFWADEGECENNSLWMYENCRQSCGQCDQKRIFICPSAPIVADIIDNTIV